jgi:hypothetical protein
VVGVVGLCFTLRTPRLPSFPPVARYGHTHKFCVTKWACITWYHPFRWRRYGTVPNWLRNRNINIQCPPPPGRNVKSVL